MKNNMDKEIRHLDYSEAEVRAVADSRIIEGYGIVFNSLSKDLGGFKELILPEAVEGVLEESDIISVLDHNINRGVLARSINGSGSLQLTKDTKGVKYSFVAPNFDLGNEVLEGIKRGDIRGSSFAFRVNESGQKWTKNGDGTYLRTITKFEKIYDMSPVYTGAYQDTTVAVRSFDEFKAKETEDNEVRGDNKPTLENTTVKPLIDTNTEELTAYYAELRETLNDLTI